MHTWTDPNQPLRLVEQTFRKEDPEPKALACYGLLLRWHTQADQPREQIRLRFAEGHPVSDITIQFTAPLQFARIF